MFDLLRRASSSLFVAAGVLMAVTIFTGAILDLIFITIAIALVVVAIFARSKG